MATQGNTDDTGKREDGGKPIDPVSVYELGQTAADGKLDPGVESLLLAELEYIKLKRPGASEGDLAGLALSGGGIRSTSFALGVMQASAREGAWPAQTPEPPRST